LTEDTAQGLAQRIGTFIQERVSADEFSGCVLVARNGKTILREAYGFANKRYGIRNLPDTKFNLGSCNKVFTKVAVMQLAERGRLSLDDHVSRHLPGYPASVAERVTIRQLLNHSSGLGDIFNEKFEETKHKLRTVDDFVDLFRDDPLSFEPGGKVQYSNAGYVLLGKIVEAVSGQDYYDYVRERVYAPAGMNDSDHYEMDEPVPNLAMGYTRMDQSGKRTDGPRRSNLFMLGLKGSPAGGGYSTVDDMLRFCEALGSGKLTDPAHTRLVYLQPSLAQAPEQADPRSFGFAGGAPGVGAAFRTYLDSGFTKVILSNYDPNSMETVDKMIEGAISQRP